jgi:tetratricopeptide (TPR) repeat protein
VAGPCGGTYCRRRAVRLFSLKEHTMTRRTVIRTTLAAATLLLAVELRADYASDYKAALDLARKDQHVEALAAFQKLAGEATTQEQKTDALEQASQSATRLQKYDEAMAIAKQIAEPSASINAQARVLAAQRSWAAVVALYDGQDLEKWPARDLGNGAMLLGNGYWGVKKGAEAARYYELAAQKHPEARTRADMYNRLGDTYRLLLNEPDKALAAYQQVYTVTNIIQKHVFAAVGIAGVYLQQNKLDEAWAELQKIDLVKLSNTYGRVELLRARAQVLAAQGKTDQALATYREALDHRDINASHKKDIEAAIAKLEGK